MSYSFQITSSAGFKKETDGSRYGSIREKLFGKPLNHSGLRLALTGYEGEAEAEAPAKPSLRRNPDALRKLKATPRIDRSGEQSAPEVPRKRHPIEYMGHLITNEQQADGRWVASFVRIGDDASCGQRTAPCVASYMAFSNAKRQIDAIAAAPKTSVREFQRVPVALDGTIFADGVAQDCQILDLSGGGARLRRSNPVNLTGTVHLYIKGFGRFRAEIVRCNDSELAVRFDADNEAVMGLLKGLSSYVQGFDVPSTKLRKDARVPTSIAAVCRMADGAAVPCEIIDASMRSMSLRITERPRVGSLVSLGKTQVRVVRHHAQGIAVQCLPSKSVKFARFNLTED